MTSDEPVPPATPSERDAIPLTISQRGLVHDVLVDVVCAGRFYDFLERRDGRWGIVRRQPIYEIDLMPGSLMSEI